MLCECVLAFKLQVACFNAMTVSTLQTCKLRSLSLTFGLNACKLTLVSVQASCHAQLLAALLEECEAHEAELASFKQMEAERSRAVHMLASWLTKASWHLTEQKSQMQHVISSLQALQPPIEASSLCMIVLLLCSRKQSLLVSSINNSSCEAQRQLIVIAYS